MAQLIDDKEIKSLLSPVELGSFMLSPGESSRSVYSGIPSHDKSKMWDFSITEDGSGNRLLSFLVNNRAVNFRLAEPEKLGGSISATRLPDTESGDFGVGGNSFKGRAQIHKSSPSKVVGTFQTGKNNMTFELSKSSENGDSWTVHPRKHPEANIKTFVNAILEKNISKSIKQKKSASYDLNRVIKEIKNVNQNTGLTNNIDTSIWDKIKTTKFKLPSVDTLTYPLTGGIGSLPVAAGIGAAAMGLKNLGQKALGKESPSMIRDLLTGAAIGGGGSALFQLLGSPNSPIMTKMNKKLMSDNMDVNKPMVFQEKMFKDPNYLELLNRAKKAQQCLDEKIAVIKKEDGEYILYTKDNKKVLGRHPTRQKAIKQEYAIQKSQERNKLAFGTGNQVVDLIALQSILGADPSLTQGDRNILIQQARRAMQSSGGRASVGSLQNMGLGMLAGYIMSKVMGFGGMGAIVSSAIGGAIGSTFGGRKGGPQFNSKGYYTY
jgi:hypothetical protein